MSLYTLSVLERHLNARLKGKLNVRIKSLLRYITYRLDIILNKIMYRKKINKTK